MSKKAIIELELKADGYKADVAEIQKANTTISDSATKAANQATEAYNQTGKAAKAAFASTEVKKAYQDAFLPIKNKRALCITERRGRAADPAGRQALIFSTAFLGLSGRASKSRGRRKGRSVFAGRPWKWSRPSFRGISAKTFSPGRNWAGS